MQRLVNGATLIALAVGFAGCRTATLSQGAQHVSAGRNPPPASCKSLGYLTGRGGGAFGGGWIANEKLVEYALNDLRNQAAKLGANYVQHDPPQMGTGDGTTTTVTITGTAYRCAEGAPPEAPANAPAAQPTAAAPAAQASAAPAPTASQPPSGAGGFEFGQTLDAAGSACTNAGYEWHQSSSDVYRCSGTVVEVGAKAVAYLRFCSDRLCDVLIEMPLQGAAPEWEKTYASFEATLRDKYGAPKTDHANPPECAAEDAARCYEDGRARRSARWEWSSGQRIVATMKKSSSGSMALRLQYSSKATPTPKPSGL